MRPVYLMVTACEAGTFNSNRLRWWCRCHSQFQVEGLRLFVFIWSLLSISQLVLSWHNVLVTVESVTWHLQLRWLNKKKCFPRLMNNVHPTELLDLRWMGKSKHSYVAVMSQPSAHWTQTCCAAHMRRSIWSYAAQPSDQHYCSSLTVDTTPSTLIRWQ